MFTGCDKSSLRIKVLNWQIVKQTWIIEALKGMRSRYRRQVRGEQAKPMLNFTEPPLMCDGLYEGHG